MRSAAAGIGLPSWSAGTGRVHIIELTLHSKMPSVFGQREYVTGGGLMSYISSIAWHWRTAASFVDKILKGAKPADIPIEQPTTFDLAINLKSAKMLGITIPQSLLQPWSLTRRNEIGRGSP
jgi:putative ABC transport system substrate-binding protein